MMQRVEQDVIEKMAKRISRLDELLEILTGGLKVRHSCCVI